jgi:GNAT superfamily N-acetyltransferase
MNEAMRYIKDGREIVIKEMDESYIFAGDMRTNPHTGHLGCCTCDGPIDPNKAIPNQVFEAYHREAMRRYGQSAILAWHDDKVVGFINFHPLNASFDILCPQVDTPENKEKYQNIEWPDKASDTLRILCVDLAPSYRRMGLGTMLAETLIEWAPSWGFKKLHVGANENAWWIPCKPFWQRLGFVVVEVIEFDEPRPDGEIRVFVMERSL